MKKLSLILVLLFLLTAFPSVSIAAEADAVDLTLGGLISEDTITENRHVAISDRLQDHLNAVEYINEDGTRSAYIFQTNIKYKQEDDTVKFIDRTPREKWGFLSVKGYEVTENRFSTLFSKNVKDGVSLSLKQSKLDIKPALAAASLSRSDSNRLTGGRLTYEPSFDGYLTTLSMGSASPESYTYSFTLSGDEVASVSAADENSVVFTLNSGEKVRCDLLDVKNSDGELLLDAEADMQYSRDAAGDYTVTYAFDPSALEDTDIDATFSTSVVEAAAATSYEDTDTDRLESFSIAQDAGIYSGTPTTNAGASDRMLVGYDNAKHISRALIQFNLSPLANIRYDQVLSAQFVLRELTGYNTSFQADCYMVQDSWTENTVTWNNKPNHFYEKMFTANVSFSLRTSEEVFEAFTQNDLDDAGQHASQWSHFYITKMVQGWLQGMPNCGVLIKERLDGTTADFNLEERMRCRAFATKEYSAYMPKLAVTYTLNTDSMDNIGVGANTTYYIKSKANGKYLTAAGNYAGANVRLTDFTGAAAQQWTVSAYGTTGTQFSIDSEYVPSCHLGGMTTNGGVHLYDSAINDYAKFTFTRNWDGSYKIWSAAGAGNYGLSFLTSPSGTHMVTSAALSVDWTQTDDWTLEPVDKGFADFMDFSNFVGDIPKYQRIQSRLITAGYLASIHLDINATTAKEYLLRDSIWVAGFHGHLGAIIFDEDTYMESTQSALTTVCIDELPENSLFKLKCLITLSCNSGCDKNGEESNLVGAAYRKGSHFVCSPTGVVTCIADQIPQGESIGIGWIEAFFWASFEGYTIYDAMIFAEEYIYQYWPDTTDLDFGNQNVWHTLGDTSACLFPGGLPNE